MFKTGVVAAALLGAVLGQNSTEEGLPIVDLGYQLHQASNFNVSKQHSFESVRQPGIIRP